MLEGDRVEAIISLGVTVRLGGLFTLLQIKEYQDASFTIADGIYGSIFFVTTGFHGVHVIIGTIFLAVNLYRSVKHHFSPRHHLGFEFGA